MSEKNYWHIVTSREYEAKKLRPMRGADITCWDESVSWEDMRRIRDSVNACMHIPVEQLRAVFEGRAVVEVKPVEVDDEAQ